MRQKPRLDLAQLNSKAANLHLMIDAAGILDLAIGAPTRQVTGPVETFARPVREWVANEALRRQFGPAEIAAGETRPSNV